MEAYLTAVHGPERALPDPTFGFYFYGTGDSLKLNNYELLLFPLDDAMLSSLIDAVRDKNKFSESEQRFSSHRKKMSKKKGPLSSAQQSEDANGSLDQADRPVNLSRQSEESDDESERVVFRQQVIASGKASEVNRMPPLVPARTNHESKVPSVLIKSKVLFEALSSLPSVAEAASAPVKPQQPRRRKKLIDTEVSPTLKMRGTR